MSCAPINLRAGHPSEAQMAAAVPIIRRANDTLLSRLAQSPAEADTVLNYTDDGRGGHACRHALASFLASSLPFSLRGVQPPDAATELMPVPGASFAIDMVVATLAGRGCGGQVGDIVVVEKLSYFLATEMFRTHGFVPHGITLDRDGMDTDELERFLAETDESLHCKTEEGSSDVKRKKATRTQPKVVAVYIMPVHHNPTGVCWSPRRRSELIRLSKVYDFIIISDEAYVPLSYEVPVGAGEGEAGNDDNIASMCILPMASEDTAPAISTVAAKAETHTQSAICDFPTVISIGTFSKVLSPGMKLGWMHARAPLLDRFSNHPFMISGGGCVGYLGNLLAAIDGSGDLIAHLQFMRNEYGMRCRALRDALGRHGVCGIDDVQRNGQGCTDAAPARPVLRAVYGASTGGYFQWLVVEPPIDAAEYKRRLLEEEHVAVLDGDRCFVGDRQQEAAKLSAEDDAAIEKISWPPTPTRGLRVCFAKVSLEEIDEAVRRMAKLGRTMLAEIQG
eukprot:TRINITY_DN13383_c0_g1_i1.p1 TRINITY_DN13383_c0_g1~~TRINITY_DN13383_c0_g1_i1.p1  ORF type:complete len:507 (-),score=78.34 TRINITY_DN13383_c0_g1_i1:39-1559(-)